MALWEFLEFPVQSGAKGGSPEPSELSMQLNQLGCLPQIHSKQLKILESGSTRVMRIRGKAAAFPKSSPSELEEIPLQAREL